MQAVQIQKLDHVNIHTANVERMVAWYDRVLGMRAGSRPPFPFPGAWIYSGNDAVIHLVGILNEKGRDGRGFRAVHVELPRKVVQACRETGVRRILHMSALHAAQGPSHYLRTKGEGEDLVHAAAAEGLRVTSFRPSVIFGPRDSFINRFAGLLRFAPFFFPLACPDARFAPVYVGDVARAFALTLEDPRSFGRRYDLCGPRATGFVGRFGFKELRVSEDHTELIAQAMQQLAEFGRIGHRRLVRIHSRLAQASPLPILRRLLFRVRLAFERHRPRLPPERVLEDPNRATGRAHVLNLAGRHPVVDRAPADADRFARLGD